MIRSRGWVRTAAAACCVVLTACAALPGERGDDRGGSGGPGGELVVFAAASLTESFRRLGSDFEAAHPGVSVTFSFAGSSTLGRQISAGAPADVFASADRRTMRAVRDAGDVRAHPVLFARNRLTIAVPPSNPADVDGIADFGREELALAVCAPEVPCGAAAQRAFDAAGVAARPDTLEQDVKAVLTKVRLGEVDAGLVYRTDVRALGAEVRGVAFPESAQAVNDYLVAPVAEAPNAPTARAFTTYVQSAAAQEVLADAGFDLP